MNIVMLIGRLTRDPELRYVASTATPVTTFTLAVDKELSKEKKQEMESKGQPTADFINVVVWGRQAESCANYLKKGILTAVSGRLQSRSYEGKDGIRRYVTEVVATRVEFLEWGNREDSSFGSQFGSGDADFPGIDGFEPLDGDDNIPF
ncbi:MAG: single-stranded DNA-binding protein [Tissierellia bacterium]|nr:single-stranded DNA-binding protein [Tissierellia bacterium]